MEQALINRIVEAALLASSQPLALTQLQALFGEDSPPPPGSVERALQDLAAANGERGIELIEVASGFRFQVCQQVHSYVARLWSERPARYSRALLETLALIAYRQPITRGEIEQIRGVAVSSHIIKTLEEREWIRVVGHRDVPGRPALFGTTRGFLDYFGLRSLDQLPPLSELADLPELEPQLPLEAVQSPPTAAAAADPQPAAEPTQATATATALEPSTTAAADTLALTDANATAAAIGATATVPASVATGTSTTAVVAIPTDTSLDAPAAAAPEPNHE